jgi:hypothetical protein
VLGRCLGGGGTASLRYDPQGKAYAQMLLDISIPVPAAWTAPGGSLDGVAAATVEDDGRSTTSPPLSMLG